MSEFEGALFRGGTALGDPLLKRFVPAAQMFESNSLISNSGLQHRKRPLDTRTGVSYRC
ncbi:MAG TPA: hypothetical protein VMT61_14000 [Candidatus Binataceae bacterium]|nr:hypothetical protein [Candidatus Binataceae bacterium]